VEAVGHHLVDVVQRGSPHAYQRLAFRLPGIPLPPGKRSGSVCLRDGRWTVKVDGPEIREAAEHIGQHATVAVVVGFTAGVEPHARREGGPVRVDVYLVWCGVSHGGREPADGDGLLTGQAEGLGDWPGRNCRGRMPMPMRLERWMRSKDSARMARTPSSLGPRWCRAGTPASGAGRPRHVARR
jgi:hypothetical protein